MHRSVAFVSKMTASTGTECTAEAGLRYRGPRTKEETEEDFLEANAKDLGVMQLKSGLQFRPLAVGHGKEKPNATTLCRVHFRSRLTDGTEFDSSYKTGQPIDFTPKSALLGWSEALQMMREGDKWELFIPSHLAYGERGRGSVPAGATLVTELELIEIGVDEEEVRAHMESKIVTPAIAGLMLLGLAMFLFHHVFHVGSSTAAKSHGQRWGPRVSITEVAGLSSNPRVFFDIEVGARPAGRIEFELFSSVVPRTAENFRALATGEKGSSRSGVKLQYKGTRFSLIVPGSICQAGQLSLQGSSESIYGSTFQDEWERGVIYHTMPGLLSMASRGPDSNGSEFFITLAKSPWLDGRHVVFGRVLHGMDVLKRLEAVGSKSGKPSETVVIVNSGQL